MVALMRSSQKGSRAIGDDGAASRPPFFFFFLLLGALLCWANSLQGRRRAERMQQRHLACTPIGRSSASPTLQTFGSNPRAHTSTRIHTPTHACMVATQWEVVSRWRVESHDVQLAPSPAPAQPATLRAESSCVLSVYDAQH